MKGVFIMGCTHDCSTCGSGCSEKNQESLIKKPHDLSNIKKVIAVVSGQGGVGKSMVTSPMSVAMNRKGYKTAILDADITGHLFLKHLVLRIRFREVIRDFFLLFPKPVSVL